MAKTFLKVRSGLSLPGISAIPSDPANGDLFYDTTLNRFRQYVNGGIANVGTGDGNGTVTSVSVVTANGLAGTVATATTTPALTLSTTITGILQGNGTAISAASTTGSGAVVLATSPTLVTPALGTPSAIVLTNGTGLPLTTGVTGTLPIANGGTNATSALSAFNNLSPLTTTGDLLTFSGGNNVRLAIGTTGFALVSNGTSPTWSQVSLTAGVTGVLPIANGGTNNSSAYTAGSVIFSSGTALTQDNANLFWDNTSKYLGVNSNTPATPIGVQGGIRLGDSGSMAGSANALTVRRAAGDSVVYITMIDEGSVTQTIKSGGAGLRQDLVFSNDAGGSYIFAPSGTNQLELNNAGSLRLNSYTTPGGLRNSSTGVVTTASAPTQQIFTTGSGTYTLPANARWIKVRMAGGGGAGGSSGTGATAGGAGSSSTFGSAFLTAFGGSGGSGPPGATGNTVIPGIATGGDINIAGGYGEGNPAGVGNGINGGYGGANPLGPGGPPGITLEAGITATGYGGGGGGASNNAATTGGGGGAGAGYLEKLITSPSATYAYTVGSGGTPSAAGTLGNQGGAGSGGIIIVEEHYL